MRTLQKIDVHGLSVPGRKHDKNHDHFAIATLNKSMRVHQTNLSIDDESRVHGHNQGHLFLVADGIGGGPTPARASGTAVDSVVQYFLNEMPWYHLADGAPKDVTVALDAALKCAQRELLESAAPGRAGMGTTVTLAFECWPDLYLAHVGDSRCYLSRKGELRRLTTDHTLAQLRRAVGGAPTENGENILWNAVGGRGLEVHPEVRHVTLESGDVLALVTDGVTDGCPDRVLQDALDADVPAETLCGRVLEGPGSDDRTAIVVRFLPRERPHAEAAAGASPSPLAAREDAPQDGPNRRRAPGATVRRSRPSPLSAAC